MADDMTDFITFKCKNEDVKVPALTFYTVDLTQPILVELNENTNWLDYAKSVLDVFMLATYPDEEESFRLEKKKEIMRKMTVPELRDLTSRLNDLLRVSGFIMLEPVEENLVPESGIGTPMSSLPN